MTDGSCGLDQAEKRGNVSLLTEDAGELTTLMHCIRRIVTLGNIDCHLCKYKSWLLSTAVDPLTGMEFHPDPDLHTEDAIYAGIGILHTGAGDVSVSGILHGYSHRYVDLHHDLMCLPRTYAGPNWLGDGGTAVGAMTAGSFGAQDPHAGKLGC